MGQTQVFQLFTTDRGQEPAIRPRFVTQQPLYYKLTGMDISQWPGFMWRWLAFAKLGDESLWDVIMDCNPIRGVMEWQQGDTVIIPLDAVDAKRTTSGADFSSLVRKVPVAGRVPQ